MRKSVMIAEFSADRKKVWDVITDLEDYGWRSDVERIEIMDGGTRFLEYSKGGHWLEFKITEKKEPAQYEFDMENQMFKGHWTGLLYETAGGGTKMELKEELTMHNQFIELLSHLFLNIKRMQAAYILDLKRKLGEL